MSFDRLTRSNNKNIKTTICLVRSSHGFTIVELMVAMSIFSVILVMSTVILIQIGSLYTKGVNTANLQNASRTIKADVSSALQFGSNVPSPCSAMATPANGTTCPASVNPSQTMPSGPAADIYAFCIGTTRYSYILGRELGTDTINGWTTPHVLWRDTLTASNKPCMPVDLTQNTPPPTTDSNGDGYEMVPTHTRLTRFKISQAAPNSNIYSVDVWMAYGDSDLVNTADNGHSTCNGGAGTQFCAVSEISTTVTGRVY